MRSLVYLLRHGETKLNDAGRYRGLSNGPDAQLNEAGIEAANNAAQFLLNLNQPFSRIIASPLDRTQLTAAIVAEYFGITKIEIDERLLPLDVGEFQGQPKTDFPIIPYLKNKNKKFPNGESVNEFEARQSSFAEYLLDVVQQTGESEVLVVCHVSNVMFWWNMMTGRGSDEYLGETTDIVLPGGIALVTEKTTIPIFKENLNVQPPVEENKLDQAEALYFDAQSIHRREGARCGACYKFIKSGACTEVEGTIVPEKVCGTYIAGTPFEIDPKLPVIKISQHTAGYGRGDTQCGNCEYFGGSLDKCRKVKGWDGVKNLQHIEIQGCCDVHDFKK